MTLVCRPFAHTFAKIAGALVLLLMLSFTATAQDRAASGGVSSVGVGSRVEAAKETVSRFVSAQQGAFSGVENTIETTNTAVINRIGQLRNTIIGTGSCRCDVPPVASCPAGQTADTNGTCCAPANQVGGICQAVPTGLTCNATQLEGCNLPNQAIQPNMSVLVNGVCAAGLVPVSGATSCNATCRADSSNAAYTSPNVGCVPSACPAGTEDVNGQCMPVCGTNQVRNAQGSCVCAPNTELVNGECIAVCPTGQVRDGQGLCAPVPCPAGTEMANNQCVPVCGTNEVRNPQGQCVCASGFEQVNGQCVIPPASTPVMGCSTSGCKISYRKIVGEPFPTANITFRIGDSYTPSGNTGGPYPFEVSFRDPTQWRVTWLKNGSPISCAAESCTITTTAAGGGSSIKMEATAVNTATGERIVKSRTFEWINRGF